MEAQRQMTFGYKKYPEVVTPKYLQVTPKYLQVVTPKYLQVTPKYLQVVTPKYLLMR